MKKLQQAMIGHMNNRIDREFLLLKLWQLYPSFMNFFGHWTNVAFQEGKEQLIVLEDRSFREMFLALTASVNVRNSLHIRAAFCFSILEHRVKIDRHGRDPRFHPHDLNLVTNDQVREYLFESYQNEISFLEMRRREQQNSSSWGKLERLPDGTLYHRMNILFASDMFRSMVEAHLGCMEYGLGGCLKFGRFPKEAQISLQDEMQNK